MEIGEHVQTERMYVQSSNMSKYQQDKPQKIVKTGCGIGKTANIESILRLYGNQNQMNEQ
jgi:hypothetical protein